jgi:hypothetical protein
MYNDERDSTARVVIELRNITITAIDDDDEEERFYIFTLHAKENFQVMLAACLSTSHA